MVSTRCNGKQEEQQMDQMSGYMVIIRNPVHNWEVTVLLQDQKDVSFRPAESTIWETESWQKKILNLPPPSTPSSCSIGEGGKTFSPE